jgi:hypothetical protein
MGSAIAGLASQAAAGTAFVALVGGPQVAIGAGVLGLVLMCKEAYSNREKRHEELIPYVWSLIDDAPPRINILTSGQSDDLDKAANHALYLMKEGAAQFERMGSKLKTAEDKFEKFMTDYFALTVALNFKQNGKWVGTVLTDEWKVKRNAAPPSQRGAYDAQAIKAFDAFCKAKIAGDKMWGDACKQGNAIFEFMRRLSHIGNYLQCGHIINVAAFKRLGSGATWVNADPLAQWTGTAYYRDRLKKISDAKKEADQNYDAFSVFMTSNNIRY